MQKKRAIPFILGTLFVVVVVVFGVVWIRDTVMERDQKNQMAASLESQYKQCTKMKKQLDTQLNRAEKYQEVQAADYKRTVSKGIVKEDDLDSLHQSYTDAKEQEECLIPQIKAEKSDIEAQSDEETHHLKKIIARVESLKNNTDIVERQIAQATQVNRTFNNRLSQGEAGKSERGEGEYDFKDEEGFTSHTVFNGASVSATVNTREGNPGYSLINYSIKVSSFASTNTTDGKDYTPSMPRHSYLYPIYSVNPCLVALQSDDEGSCTSLSIKGKEYWELRGLVLSVDGFLATAQDADKSPVMTGATIHFQPESYSSSFASEMDNADSFVQVLENPDGWVVAVDPVSDSDEGIQCSEPRSSFQSDGEGCLLGNGKKIE